MRPTRTAALAAALLALVAATPAAAQAQRVVKIGAALSMTGAGAVYGASQKAGILLAVEELNGKNAVPGARLEVVVEDDASTTGQGINVVQRFMNRDKVAVVLGPTLSTTATAADPLAQRAGVPVLAISNTAEKGITDIGDCIWRVSLMEKQVVPTAIEKARQRFGFKTAAILYGNDDVFTKSGYDVMRSALDAKGVKVLGTQTFAKPDRDYNAQLTSLAGQNPDVLLVSALAENAAGIVVQARQLGYTGPILGGNGFNSPAFVKNAGPAAEGVLVGTAWNAASPDPANQAFIAAMKARGVNPDQFAAQAYTGVLVVAEALRQGGGDLGREAVKAGFRKVKDLPTPLGKFSFLPTRDANHEPAVQIVKDGRFVPLS
jgi:branched-chain amino acid transport system substrate-binding protein